MHFWLPYRNSGLCLGISDFCFGDYRVHLDDTEALLAGDSYTASYPMPMRDLLSMPRFGSGEPIVSAFSASCRFRCFSTDI